MTAVSTPQERTVAHNRRARRDYEILETFEAGLSLLGCEVKSLRNGQASLSDAHARVQGGEFFLFNLHIPPYEKASHFSHDPLRPRKLLLHRREIRRLIGRVEAEGYTLVPLKLYFKRGWAKVELALAKGRKQYDKRRKILKKEARREIEHRLKGRR